MNGITPAFILLLLALSIGILAAKKDLIIVPIIIAMCFLPGDISVKIGSLDFQGVRIMALVGLLKVSTTTDYDKFQMNLIDKLFIAYNLLGAIIYIIASKTPFSAFLYQGGQSIDSIILYIVFRYAIQSKESVYLIIKTFTFCVLMLLPFVIFEFYTATNLFSILGRSHIAYRNGEIRAAATFSHSILFGSFAVALIPILWADLMTDKNKLKIAALLSCVFFIYACSSSGPIVVLAVVISFLCFFKWKQYSVPVSWFLFFSATFIHLIREKPIWHLLYIRLSVKASSTGFHRYLLMEAAVRDFWSWWLLGYGDVGPKWHLEYWPWTHARFTDVTNQYILVGVRGGFFTMLIFIILCYQVIRTLGAFAILQENKQDQWLWWGFAGMMIAHCVTFLSVAYFGQITMLLFLTIAVSSLAYDESMKLKNSVQSNSPAKSN